MHVFAAAAGSVQDLAAAAAAVLLSSIRASSKAKRGREAEIPGRRGHIRPSVGPSLLALANVVIGLTTEADPILKLPLSAQRLQGCLTRK